MLSSSRLETRKLYVLANAERKLLTKRMDFSSQSIGVRRYATLAQAERFAAKFNAGIYTVYIVCYSACKTPRVCSHAIADAALYLGLTPDDILG